MPAHKVDLLIDSVESPIGTIHVVCRGHVLCAVKFADFKDRMLSELWTRFGDFRLRAASNPGSTSARIRAYLRGAFDAVNDIVVDGGGTEFQQKVWAELRNIAPGEVLSYAALAERVGAAKAVRAVGFANSLNPINIVVPCHRVIGADGSLRGYSGGLERKYWLLEHEGVALSADATAARSVGRPR